MVLFLSGQHTQGRVVQIHDHQPHEARQSIQLGHEAIVLL